MNGPYKGLAAFDDPDAAFFFGRDREREIVTANLMASRLTVLYGASGVGKSSLLRAGVVHQLRQSARETEDKHGEPELTVVLFDSWTGDPVQGLIEAIADSLDGRPEGDQRHRGPPSLVGILGAASRAVNGDVYVILDQFEEYFVYHGDGAADEFAIALADAVRTEGLRTNFLVSLRDDALAELDRFAGKLPSLFANTIRVEHLDRQAGRDAIVEPPRRYAALTGATELQIEEGLAEEVLDEVAAGRMAIGGAGVGVAEGTADQTRIEAPYLQLVMERLWTAETEAGSSSLRLATLRELGGARRIVEAHFDEAMATLTPEEQELAARIFGHLITPSGTKIAHDAGDLAQYAGVTEKALGPVLSSLAKTRILRPTAAPGGELRFEIFHDVLAEPALAWRQTRLAEAELARARRRHRRLLLVVGACLVAVAAMVAVTVFAVTQRGEARDQARLAQSRELAASALSVVAEDPELALLLALEGAETEATPQAESALREALISSRVRTVAADHEGPITQTAFGPEGRLIVTASDDGTARLFVAMTGEAVAVLNHDGPVTSASFAPDGARVVTASADGAVRVWSVPSGTLLATYRHDGPVEGALLDSEGAQVLSWSADGTARLWAPAGDTLIFSHRAPVLSAALAPGGTLVATAGEDGTARVFDARTGDLLHVLDHEKPVTGIAFSPDGALVITAGKERVSRIWAAASGELVHELGEHRGVVTSASFSPDGKLAVTTSADGAARVWDVDTGARTAIFLGHTNEVSGSAFSPDGSLVVSVSSDRTARVWETTTGRAEVALLGHRDTVTDAEFGPDGTSVVTASLDGTARVWDAAPDPVLAPLAHIGSPTKAAYTPDGRYVPAVPASGRPRLLDSETGEVVRWFDHEGATASAISPEGSLLATATGSDIRLWGTEGDRPLRSLTTESPVRTIAFSHDGQRLLAVGEDGIVRVLGTADGKTLLRIRGRDATLTDATFSPDGSLIATGAAGGKAAIWDAASGELQRELKGHTDDVTAVAFSSDGSRLVTVSGDGDGRVWDAESGGLLRVLRGHFGPIADAMFSPNGRWIVTAGPVTAGLWDVEAGRLLFFLRGHTAVLTSAAFDPTGRRILTASRAGSVRDYRCEICGTIDELAVLAEQRLAKLGRTLTADERARFLDE
jgi:WD40 repeat protein